MTIDLSNLQAIAHEAGQAILEVYGEDEFAVEHKADDSPLTQADLASHRRILKRLRELTPDVPILSEESKSVDYTTRRTWNRFWLVDPLDGTKEFVKRNGEFTVNIALIEKGKPVMGVVHVPVQDRSYLAAQGEGAFKFEGGTQQPIRAAGSLGEPFTVVASRSHAGAETQAFLDALGAEYTLEVTSKGSSLKLCLVAEGAADLYPRLGPTMEWDTAAAQCVVEQAGGKVTTLSGEALKYNKENLLNPYFMVSSPATETLWQGYLKT